MLEPSRKPVRLKTVTYVLGTKCHPAGPCFAWRRRRDSNPRDPHGPNGFQDRRFQPLTHSSINNYRLCPARAAYSTHLQVVPGVFSQYSTCHALGLCAVVQLIP